MPQPGRARTGRPASGREPELVQRACAGDERAFAELVELHGPMVLGLAYGSTLDRSEAEDVAQETFLAAWRGLSAFRGEASFSTWLYGLARSRCIDRARRAAVRPRLAAVHGREVAAPAGSEPRRIAAVILAAAARLPLEQRQALLMRDLHGLSYDEIAELQDVPIGTVRSRIATARRAVAGEVGEL